MIVCTLAALVALQTQPGPAAPSAAQRWDSAVEAALAQKDYANALELADEALIGHPNDGWLLYDRGVALAGLLRLEEAQVALARSQAAFPADQPWGRALAAYRRGLVLEKLGRCDEARASLMNYQTLLRQIDPRLERDAMAVAEQCPSGRQPVRGRENVEGRPK